MKAAAFAGSFSVAVIYLGLALTAGRTAAVTFLVIAIVITVVGFWLKSRGK